MYSLRQASEQDFDFLLNLHFKTMRVFIEPIWGWHIDWQKEYFRKKFNPQERQIIVIDGRDAGVLVVEDRADELYLGLIEIQPEFQGQGIGTEIIRSLKGVAQKRGIPMVLHVLRTNQPARRLYERLGFRVTHEDDTRCRMVWDRDVIGNNDGE